MYRVLLLEIIITSALKEGEWSWWSWDELWADWIFYKLFIHVLCKP